jgi:hypothetical protein
MALGLTKIDNTSILTSTSIAAATTTFGTAINAAATEWFQVVNITVSVTFNTSGSEDAIVHVRKSVDGGTTDDSADGTGFITIPFVASGGTYTKTFDVYDFDYLDVGVENQEAATYSVTAVIDYSGYKITGMA